MAEQLALDQLARDRRHVDRHEWPAAAAAVIVQGAGHQLLAGTAFAVDHHGEVRRGEPCDRAINLLHGGAAADQRQALVAVARGRFAGGDLGQGGCQSAPNDGQQLLEIEGFRQIFEGPALGCLHRRHQGGLSGHHDHPQIRAGAADARQQVQPVFVGHHHVGDHQIALAILHPAPQRGGVGGGAHLVARSPQSLGQYRADRAVVVGDEDGGRGHDWS